MSARPRLPDTVQVFERGWLSANNVVLFDGGEATLVDSGYVSHAAQTVALVRAALDGRRLGRLINTHSHSDHIGGNAYDCQDAGGVMIHRYGPHIFHTSSDQVVSYLSQFTEWRDYEHRVLAHVDGQQVKSCTVFALDVQGAQVTTIEGMANKDGSLGRIQQAFQDHHGLQCGFCTPGMLMRAYRFLQENPNPSEDEIRHGMAGNLCRCTGYQNIVKAVQYAAKKLQEPVAA